MSILLIRHGETAGNRDRVMQRPDVPLSERGMDQATRLARRLADAGVALIISSDLARAEMTARAIERATGSPLEFDPLLAERDFGDLRGTAYSDLTEDPFAPGYAPPRGETWDVFDQRVERVWKRIRDRAATVEGALAVVTHGLVCHSLCSHHLELSPPLAREASSAGPMRFGNTALTVIERQAPWRIERFACTAHLEGMQDGGEGLDGARA